MAFIIDIRRGNLREHLLYKALMEMSPDRAGFLSRLFSRERPAGLTPETSVQDLFAAYDALPATDANYRRNLAAVIEWLTTKRRLPLLGLRTSQASTTSTGRRSLPTVRISAIA